MIKNPFQKIVAKGNKKILRVIEAFFERSRCTFFLLGFSTFSTTTPIVFLVFMMTFLGWHFWSLATSSGIFLGSLMKHPLRKYFESSPCYVVWSYSSVSTRVSISYVTRTQVLLWIGHYLHLQEKKLAIIYPVILRILGFSNAPHLVGKCSTSMYMKIPGDPYRSPKDSQGSYFLHVSVSDCIWKPLFSTNSSYFHPTWAICGAKVLGPFVALPHLFWVVFFYS